MIDTKLIFSKRHKVTVPAMATFNDKDILERGVPTTGIEEMDIVMHNTPTTVYATIAEQITYWERGYTVRFKSSDVMMDIVKAIYTYLRQWSDIVKGTYNAPDTPSNDLETLEEYAVSLERMLSARGVTTNSRRYKHEPFSPLQRSNYSKETRRTIPPMFKSGERKSTVKVNPSVRESYETEQVSNIDTSNYSNYNTRRRI